MKVLITGATSGIGQQLVADYACEGHNVIACGRNADALKKLADEFPDYVETLQFDTVDREKTIELLGSINQIDVAILSAGVCEYLDIESFDAELFERVFTVNVQGTMNCVQGLLRTLQPGSKLVLVGSLARLLPFTRAQAYGGSKAAIHYITRSLEVDLAPKGIRVLSISPGFVKTPMTDANDFEMPMRVSVDYASQCIRKGIEKNKRDIGFPTIFTLMLKTMSILPQAWQVALSKRMSKGNK
ncbi:SDR family NAD(P)-dependent oxidoreductase [Idiomarina sp.]|uniref:SDR family NAD(P)-dependent oxidoreductase n=2 Tax=Idiomarina TaxID=135575 RepID=UPI003513DD8A